MRLYLCLVCCLLASSALSEEVPEHGGGRESTKHTVDGEHNPEYDHEAIIGSRAEHEEFENLSAEEARKRLSKIIDKMDANADKAINREELVQWVVDSFKSLDKEEAEEAFGEHDENEDGSVSLKEYLEQMYGYTVEEMDKWYHDLEPEMQHYAQLVKEDKEKFSLADRDGDGVLSLEEYHGFYHPWSRDYMHDAEVERTLKEHDQNADGYISAEEYMGGENVEDEEDELIEIENFKAFDLDSDGRLDREEIKKWVIPDHEESAEDEAEHLIAETDEDNDGVLSLGEILKKVELWVGSAVTDYGSEVAKKLHDPAEL